VGAYAAAMRLPNALPPTYPVQMFVRHQALCALLRRLRDLDYRFIAVTPATHARVLARPAPASASLRDVFGWTRPFSEPDLPSDVIALMRQADVIEPTAGGLVSAVRVASLGEDLFCHSRYPTDAQDAVFFGPDTYRFADFIRRHLPLLGAQAILDYGAGSGAGGIAAARVVPGAALTLLDINPPALDLARVNLEVAGLNADVVDDLEDVDPPDVIIANPPYIMDDSGRAYRDGGNLLGGQVPLAWAERALATLQPGGTLLLYTGAAHSEGQSPLLAALATLCADQSASLVVEEIDPDVFGEEIDKPAYAAVERIAAVGVVITKPR
jgi:methylase of polypeptide subunit release factors